MSWLNAKLYVFVEARLGLRLFHYGHVHLLVAWVGSWYTMKPLTHCSEYTSCPARAAVPSCIVRSNKLHLGMPLFPPCSSTLFGNSSVSTQKKLRLLPGFLSLLNQLCSLVDVGVSWFATNVLWEPQRSTTNTTFGQMRAILLTSALQANLHRCCHFVLLCSRYRLISQLSQIKKR